MSTQDTNLGMLQAQYEDISKRLKTAKKARDAQQRIAGKAILDVIETQPDSGTSKMLVDLLSKLVNGKEDREAIGLDERVKKMKFSVPSAASVTSA
jgi:hypothetical protein